MNDGSYMFLQDGSFFTFINLWDAPKFWRGHGAPGHPVQTRLPRIIASQKLSLSMSCTRQLCDIHSVTTYTRSLAIAKRPCDCCIILKSGSYTKVIIIVLTGLFQSNRDHRLTFRRVIVRKWMYTAQVPINNALVLSNLSEYRHKWYIAKTRFFRLHFHRRLYRSIFDHFDVIDP